MDSYSKLQDAISHRKLKTEELNRLLSLIGTDEEELAVARIIECYQRVVYSIAQKLYRNSQYYVVGVSLLDFVQQGNLGLWIAIKKYDAEKGAFSSFAKQGIKSSIIRLIENTSGIVRKTSRIHERWRNLKKREVLTSVEKEEFNALNKMIISSMQNFEVQDISFEIDDSQIIEDEFLLLVEKGLSKRHADVLRARMAGFKNTEIASRIGCSRKTVISLFGEIRE